MPDQSDPTPGSAARCPFCEAKPGQAVTATDAQAEEHREHKAKAQRQQERVAHARAANRSWRRGRG